MSHSYKGLKKAKIFVFLKGSNIETSNRETIITLLINYNL